MDIVEGGTIPDVYNLIKRTLDWGMRPDATTEDKKDIPQTSSRTSLQKEDQSPKEKPKLSRSVSLPWIKDKTQGVNAGLTRSVSLPSLKLESSSSKDQQEKSSAVPENLDNKDKKAKPQKASNKLRGLFSKKKHLDKSSEESVKVDTRDAKKKFKSVSLPSLRLGSFFSKKDTLQKSSGASLRPESRDGKYKAFRSFSWPSLRSLKLSGLFSRKTSDASVKVDSQDNNSDIPDSKSPSLHKLHTEWNESIINVEVLLGLKKPKNSYEALAVEKEFGPEKPYWKLDEESSNSTTSRDSVISRDAEISSDEGASGVTEARDAQGTRDNKRDVDGVDSGVASRGVSSKVDQSLS